MYKIGCLALAFTIVSCSTGYRMPESVDEKIARYETKSGNSNLIPAFKIMPLKRVTGRRPASIKSNDFARGYSNKRLYFLTLYTQYNKLVHYSQSEAPNIRICPGFNTSIQKDREQFPSFKARKQQISSVDPIGKSYSDVQLARHPELSLPVVKDSIYPTVADIAGNNAKRRKELLSKAIDIHIIKTYSELAELCETGSSSNYYTFENLYTHVKGQQKFRASKDNLVILMKTTIFANQSLLHSLKKQRRGRSIASTGPRVIYLNELITRFQVPWFTNYLHNISKK